MLLHIFDLIKINDYNNIESFKKMVLNCKSFAQNGRYTFKNSINLFEIKKIFNFNLVNISILRGII